MKTLYNLAYFRSRAYKINKHVQDNLIDIPKIYITYTYKHNNKTYDFKYYKDQYIICRQSLKRKNAQCFTNYMYKILKINILVSEVILKKHGFKKAIEMAQKMITFSVFKIFMMT